jgi:hypothetical protein
MNKTRMLECLGFYLARVLIFQAGNDAWNFQAGNDAWNLAQNGSLILLDVENHHQSLTDMSGKQNKPLCSTVNNRNAD